MQLTLTTRRFHFSDKDTKHLEKFVQKLTKIYPQKEHDFPRLEIVLQKNHKKSLEHVGKALMLDDLTQSSHGHKTVDNPDYYDGTLDLILPKRRLVAKMLGATVEEAVKHGFGQLIKELDRYKGQYFTDDSEYRNRSTIRQNL